MLRRFRNDYVCISDEQLMLAHAAGDPEAFTQLHGRYAQRLLRLMARQRRVHHDAHDLVQQTFLQVHRASVDFDPNRCFRPWLYAIALNIIREAQRKQRRMPPLSNGEPGAAEPIAATPGFDEIQVARAVRLAIEALRPEQREVIELYWFEGLSFPEIAHCLGIPVPTAKVRAHRGYQLLRARLAGAPSASTRTNGSSTGRACGARSPTPAPAPSE